MITLVTATFNAEKTIERTLLSVESQSYSEVQHIIMDGGSKDNTIALVEAYRQRTQEKGFEVVIISEPDKGLYDAMNKSFKLAEGEYICFLNAGDKLHSTDTLQHVANASKPDSVGIIYGDTDIVDDNGNKLRSRRLTPPEHLTWKSFKDGMLVCHQSFYVNREIAQNYNLKYRFSADFDWCIRSMKVAEELDMHNTYLHETLSDYLSEGMTTENHKASLIERYNIMCKHYGLMTAIAQHLWFIIRAVLKK